MKSYSVKSNAKRFARGVAAKHPGKLEAIEPVEVGVDGAREWFPAVRIAVKVCGYGAQQAFIDEFGDVALIQWKALFINGGADPAILAEGDAGVYSIPPDDMTELAEAEASGLKEMFDAVEPAGDIDIKVHATPEMIERGELTVDFTFPAQVIGVPESLATMAASLPPRVESSREEIDRRRAERRARIDAEKATGARTPSGAKPKKISKKQIILDLVARGGGATQAEIVDATGWQRHTLRGYIAGTLRKILAPVGVIECRKVKTDDGEKETRYVFVKHGAAA